MLRTRRVRSAANSRMPGGCSTCMATSPSGATIRTTRTTTSRAPSRQPLRGRPMPSYMWSAAARGARGRRQLSGHAARGKRSPRLQRCMHGPGHPRRPVREETAQLALTPSTLMLFHTWIVRSCSLPSSCRSTSWPVRHTKLCRKPVAAGLASYAFYAWWNPLYLHPDRWPRPLIDYTAAAGSSVRGPETQEAAGWWSAW